MMRLALVIVALLTVLVPGSSVVEAAAGSVSVSPAEVSIDNLLPGEPVDFEMTIRNEEGQDRVFVLTVYRPADEARIAGREELPDERWISFSPAKVEVGAGCEASIRVTVAVPQDEDLMGEEWEIWLGVAPQSGELLVVKYYVRLFISTRHEAEGRHGGWLLAGSTMASILAGYGAYCCLRRKREIE